MKYILLFCYLAWTGSYSQMNNDSGIGIGTKVPDIVISNIVNYKTETVNIADFRGKVVILDFWNKYCKACISAFPKMEKLQEQFRDKLQIFLVTNNTRDELQALFKKSIIIKNLTLPMVLSDTILYQLFPHTGEPFHVWLDSEGVVVRLASAQNEATYENVIAVLRGKKMESPNFSSQQNFDRNMPLIVEGGGRQWKHLQFYSMIMRGIVGQNAFQNTILKDPITRNSIWNGTKIHNASIYNLLAAAYGRLPKVIVEGRHSEDFYIPKKIDEVDLWRDTMTFSYESIIPAHLKNKRDEVLRQTLENYFDIYGKIEKRKIKCYIIKSVDNSNLIKSHGGDNVFEHTKKGWVIRNVPYEGALIKILSKDLIGTKDAPVIFDETGYPADIHIDINVSKDLKNLEELNRELLTYGLIIRVDRREIDCLILRDKPFKK